MDRGARGWTLPRSSGQWDWVDPSTGWSKAHCVLKPSGWLAVLGHVVVRRLDEPEVYAETIDLHERFAPGNPGWGHPPLEDEVRLTGEGWGPPNEDSERLFGTTVVRWYPTVQWFDGEGFADLLRSNSLYRRLEDGCVRRCSTQSPTGSGRGWVTGWRVTICAVSESVNVREAPRHDRGSK